MLKRLDRNKWTGLSRDRESEREKYNIFSWRRNATSSTSQKSNKTSKKMTSPAAYLGIHLSCSSSSSSWWRHRRSSSRKRRARQAGCRIRHWRFQLPRQRQRRPSADESTARRRGWHRASPVDVRTAALTSMPTTATCGPVAEPFIRPSAGNGRHRRVSKYQPRHVLPVTNSLHDKSCCLL